MINLMGILQLKLLVRSKYYNIPLVRIPFTDLASLSFYLALKLLFSKIVILKFKTL